MNALALKLITMFPDIDDLYNRVHLAEMMKHLELHEQKLLERIIKIYSIITDDDAIFLWHITEILCELPQERITPDAFRKRIDTWNSAGYQAKVVIDDQSIIDFADFLAPLSYRNFE